MLGTADIVAPAKHLYGKAAYNTAVVDYCDGR